MRSNEVFPSKWLKPEDLGPARPIVTITSVERVKMFGGDLKPVVHFHGREKGLVLNKTNWRSIEEITGEADSDNWAGHRIRLYVTPVAFQNNSVAGIRIMAPDVSREEAPRPRPVQPPPTAVDRAFPNHVAQPDVDDIPF